MADNLADDMDDGGFQIVPGFHRHFETWAKTLGPAPARAAGVPEARNYEFDPARAVARRGVRLPMRAGSMVVWDQRCAHGSCPNASSRVRMAQFLTMVPATQVPGGDTGRAGRAAVVRERLRAAGLLGAVTPLGRRVFDLDRAP